MDQSEEKYVTTERLSSRYGVKKLIESRCKGWLHKTFKDNGGEKWEFGQRESDNRMGCHTIECRTAEAGSDLKRNDRCLAVCNIADNCKFRAGERTFSDRRWVATEETRCCERQVRV